MRTGEKRKGSALGSAILGAGAIAILGGILESSLSRPGDVSLADLLYGANVHLLCAVVLTLVLRLLFLAMRARVFPWIAAAAMLGLELAIVLPYWLNVRGVVDPFESARGKLLTIVLFLAGAVLAALLTFGIYRLVMRRSPARSTAPAAFVGWAGMLLGFAVIAVNLILVYKEMPKPTRPPLRAEAATMERPNVVILLIDTLRRDHVGFFGYERPTTPALDQLLRESYAFSAAYTPSTWTIPSIASLFTGVAPSSHGTYGRNCTMPRGVETLAQSFQGYGYHTAAFVANSVISAVNGYDQGFDLFLEHAFWWGWDDRTFVEGLAKILSPRGAKGGRGFGPVINARFLRWAEGKHGEPLFAYLHYMDPHDPYSPPPGYREAVAPGAPLGPHIAPSFHDYLPEDAECGDWECVPNPPLYSEREMEGMLANYDGDIRHVDALIGELVASLRERGLLDRTHLLVFSDHGEEFFEHRGWRHGRSIYEEMSGCVMAYRPPGGVPGGRIIDRPVAMLDLPRTVTQILGIELAAAHQGRPIAEILEGHAGPELPVVCERPPSIYSLRLRNWKVLRRGPTATPEFRLYDLVDDPLEQNDLSRVWPDTLVHFRDMLLAIVAAHESTPIASERIGLDARAVEQLRALGYIN